MLVTVAIKYMPYLSCCLIICTTVWFISAGFPSNYSVCNFNCVHSIYTELSL